MIWVQYLSHSVDVKIEVETKSVAKQQVTKQKYSGSRWGARSALFRVIFREMMVGNDVSQKKIVKSINTV